MNKRGQALITFVLILPLLIFFIAFFIDSMMGMMERKRINGIITSNMEIILNKEIKDEKKIVEVIKNNDNTLSVSVKVDNDDIKIMVHGKKKNIFGNIFKIKHLDLDINYCANYLDKRINKECAG